jgi:polysaccharide biosynthesis/export protein
MRKFLWGMLILALAMTPVAATAQQSGGSGSSESAREKSSDTMPVPATVDPSYRINPQDMLAIDVWKEPEISRLVPVRPDGRISLPLLEDVEAAGLTPMQLADSITQKLQKYISNPNVTVIVTQMNSQRIYIMGEVGRPGAYPLLPGMTLLQALSNAGGFSPFANLKKIHLIREENGRQTRHEFNYRDMLRGRNTDQNIALKPGDTIIVP